MTTKAKVTHSTEEAARKPRKTMVGVVTSDKREKTITVKVDTFVAHPVYKKRQMYSQKYSVHDEREEASVGDTVEIMHTRPLSKTKYFRLVSIKSKAVKK